MIKKHIKLSPYTMFYRKLYEHVLSRLDVICYRLYGSQSNKFEKIIWNLFENYTQLLFCSRDLHQIILSSIYYVANSNLFQYEQDKQELTWSRLIQVYKPMPNSKLKTVRNKNLKENQLIDLPYSNKIFENIKSGHVNVNISSINYSLNKIQTNSTSNVLSSSIQVGTNNTVQTVRTQTEDGKLLTTISTISKINNSNSNQDNIRISRNEKNLFFFGQSTNNSMKRTFSDDSNSNCLTSLTKKSFTN
ncbi:unnamed protein product [Rotaria sp. Silwood1]|nr:unnamed protein product [Rotaria sp. Silwood1]CAF1688696.1 unnamed protein product [Rotaria sp. Silwood1]